MGFGEITNEVVKLATTHGLAKDVIDLLTVKLTLLESENATLKQESASLRSENDNLRRQIGDHKNEFKTHNGILWKRTETGYERNPYCPECANHPVMMEFPPKSREMWACPVGHTFAFSKLPELP